MLFIYSGTALMTYWLALCQGPSYFLTDMGISQLVAVIFDLNKLQLSFCWQLALQENQTQISVT